MKTRLRIVVLLALTAGLLVIGGHAGYQELMAWYQTQRLKRVQQYLEQGESRKALLCLERALQHDPQDVRACRLMACLTEAAHSPDALAWRSRVLELAPQSLDDRFALAQSALTFGCTDLAASALEAVAPADQRTARYHNAAGVVAMALNEPARAEASFREAARIEPGNEASRFNLAMIQLQGTNFAKREEARAMLKRISLDVTHPVLRRLAFRELAVTALREQPEVALEWSEHLLQETNPAFSDRLLWLEALRQTRKHDFTTALAACQREAESDPGKICEFARWRMKQVSPADALAWLRSLPMNEQTNQPVALLGAECLALRQDWRGLQDWLIHGNWGQWEFIRHAFATLALRGQGLNVAAATEWASALRSAHNQKLHLIMLLRLAAQWDWLDEKEGLLWTLVNSFPEERWAFRELNMALYNGGQTRSLMKLYQQERKRSSSNLTIKNNLALLALLLDAKELAPHELAYDVYRRAPTNAFYASTYAFSLYLQNRNAEALKVMEQLDPRALQNPSIAGYYGLVLTAAGEKAKAATFLEVAKEAPMLPEERAIFGMTRRTQSGAER